MDAMIFDAADFEATRQELTAMDRSVIAKTAKLLPADHAFGLCRCIICGPDKLAPYSFAYESPSQRFVCTYLCSDCAGHES